MQPKNIATDRNESARGPGKTTLRPETKHDIGSSKVMQSEGLYLVTEDQIELPDPEYRNVAGNVTRKRDSTVTAAPPPANARRAMSQSEPQQSHYRRTTSNRLRSNSDSDSDSDSDSNRKLNVKGDGAGVARRREQPARAAPNPSLPNSQLIEQEERERTQLLRALKDVADKWSMIYPQRKAHRANRFNNTERLLDKYDGLKYNAYSDLLNVLEGVAGEARETALQKFSEDWDDLHGMQRIQDDIAKWDKSYNDFLDEALYGAVEKKLLGGGPANEGASKPVDYIEDVIRQVERVLLSRCSAFDPAERKWGYLASSEVRLADTLQALNRKLCSYLSDLHDRERSDWAVKAASIFIQEKFPVQFSSANNPGNSNSEEFVDDRPPLNISIDAFVDAYLEAIIRALVVAFLGAPEDGRLVDITGSSGPIHAIKTSRRDGHMTREYIEWACSNIPPHLIEQCCVQWQKNLRAETARQYRDTMNSIVKIEQEFCLDIAEPCVVSLVLFKENYPATLRNVSPEDLKNMGWFMHGHQKVEYWRWELDTFGRRNVIRAVSMDGEVLGLWTPKFSYFQG